MDRPLNYRVSTELFFTLFIIALNKRVDLSVPAERVFNM